jgi:hypothetical protein
VYSNVVALLNEHFTEWNILDMLHHLAVHIVVAVRFIAMHLLKLTAEVVRIGNLLLV